jgi:hypothetical protein
LKIEPALAGDRFWNAVARHRFVIRQAKAPFKPAQYKFNQPFHGLHREVDTKNKKSPRRFRRRPSGGIAR